MINVYTRMPDVDWSTVPGPRSRGYSFKKDEDAEKAFDSLARQLRELGLGDAFVESRGEGELKLSRAGDYVPAEKH